MNKRQRAKLIKRFDKLDKFEQKSMLQLLFSSQKSKDYHLGDILGGYYGRGDVAEEVYQFCDRTNRTMDDLEFNEVIDHIFDYFSGLEFAWIYETFDEFIDEAIQVYYGEIAR